MRTRTNVPGPMVRDVTPRALSPSANGAWRRMMRRPSDLTWSHRGAATRITAFSWATEESCTTQDCRAAGAVGPWRKCPSWSLLEAGPCGFARPTIGASIARKWLLARVRAWGRTATECSRTTASTSANGRCTARLAAGRSKPGACARNGCWRPSSSYQQGGLKSLGAGARSGSRNVPMCAAILTL